MKKWQMWTVGAVVVIAVGLGCLFGGKAWGDSGSPNTDGQFPRNGAAMGRGDGPMPSGGFAGRNGGGMVSGSIIAVDSNSITIQTPDGNTKIVLFGASAAISLVTQGSAADLTTGANVVVSGTTNTDGTVTATSIRLGDSLSVAPGAPPTDGTSTTPTTAQ
jgi:hypothetical protein